MSKRPKIEIGTTFPYQYDGRIVNAEVVACEKIGSRRSVRKRNWWTVRLAESQQPIVRDGGGVEFHASTRTLTDYILWTETLPTFGPARNGSCVVQWIDFGHRGLWCEIRENTRCGSGRPTFWTRSQHETSQDLISSGDALITTTNQIGAAT